MAVTRITSGKNIRTAVEYTTTGKAHNPNKYIGTNRNLANTAVNGSPDPDLFIMNALTQLKRDGLYHKGQAQELRTIISFDPKQISIKDPNSISKAEYLSREITKAIYPHNSSLITIQADGEGKNKYHQPIVHAHIITCSRRLDNGKSITHDATFKKLQPKIDQVIHQHGYKLPPSPYKTITKQLKNGKTKQIKVMKTPKHDANSQAHKINERLHKQGKSGWIEQMSNILDDIKSRSVSRNQYMHFAFLNGITVNPFRMQRVKGTKGKNGQYQYKFHIYKSNQTKAGKPRKGHYVKIDHDLITLLSQVGTKNLAKNAHIADHKGEYLRLSKQVKYTYKGKVVRAKKLGSVYDIPALEKTFKANAKADNVNSKAFKQKIAQSEDKLINELHKENANRRNNGQEMQMTKQKPKAKPADDDEPKKPKANNHNSAKVANKRLLFNMQSLNAYTEHRKLKTLSIGHSSDGVMLIKTPKTYPIYHAKPKLDAKLALGNLKYLTSRISNASGKTKADLILQKHDQMAEFDDRAQEYIGQMEESRQAYADAKANNKVVQKEYEDDELAEERDVIAQLQANFGHQSHNFHINPGGPTLG